MAESGLSLKLNRSVLLLGLILLLAAGLRIYSLNGLGFWIDEFCTLSEVNGWGLQVSHLPGSGVLPAEPPSYTHRANAQPVSQLIERLSREDAHPPLYFLLLRGWMDLFGGDSESIVRSLNVVFSLAAIVLLYAAVTEQPQHGPSVALWACLLMALAGPQIEFSQEARNYIPLETFSLAAAVALLRIGRLGTSRWRLGALALATAAMLLTHYAAIAVIAAMALHALWNFRGRARWLTLAALASGAVAFAIIWAPMALRQRPIFTSGHLWLLDESPGRITRLALLLLQLPARLLIEPGNLTALIGITLVGIAGWLLVAIGLRRPGLRFWALWMICVVGVVFATDVVHHTAQLKFVRFTLPAAPALYVLVACTVLRSPIGRTPIRWAIPVAVALFEAIAVPRAFIPPWKIDFRTPALAIAERLQPDDGLVFVGPPGDDVGLALTYNGIRHYLPASEPTTVAVLQSAATPADLARLAACRNVWVVWLTPQDRPLSAVLPGFMPQETGHVPYFIDLYRGHWQTKPAGL